MNTPLRLLLVDDNPDDRALVIRELRREFPDLQVQQITEALGWSRALDAGAFDLVITDYQLRWADGLAVLRAVKDRWPDCPVIMFSNTGSEEIAVEAMKSGLNDYVLKSPKHLVRLRASVRSVLEQTQWRQRRRLSEERNRALVDNAPVCIHEMDLSGRLTSMNKAGLQMIGLENESQILGISILDIVAPEDRERIQGLLTSASEGQASEFEYTIMVGLEKRYYTSNFVPLKSDSGSIVKLMGISQDVTARKQGEEQLKNSYEQLRALSARLQTVREEEGTRIAREIHDELGQALTALKMDLSWLARRLPRDLKSLSEKTQEMITLVDKTFKSVRKISAELRPTVLDDLGLLATIEWQAQDFQRRTGIRCAFTSRPEEIQVEQDHATALFRILQEALTNVARHAHATRVNVGLAETAGSLILEVKDNGKGIGGREISDPKSLGLLGMRERALAFGGEITIKGVAGEGTTVTVRIPLKKPGGLQAER